MKDKFDKNATQYFKDSMQIALIVTGVFLVCVVAALIINGFKIWNVLILLVYLVIMAMLVKPIIGYYKACMDLKYERFFYESVEINYIEPDKSMNLYTKDGLSGDKKYVLSTDMGEFYVGECRAKGAQKLNSENVLIENATFDIAYLGNSKIIVDMKPTVSFEEPEVTERFNTVFYALYSQFK